MGNLGKRMYQFKQESNLPYSEIWGQIENYLKENTDRPFISPNTAIQRIRSEYRKKNKKGLSKFAK